ncbi:putative bifunctional diguanylate cyclase/phosphodiesterase [Ciceribacter thiooxidans]|uniref:Bifunctional diguanylate cyclase/phosphodiesterase n=1 Tax=Ciceribacter thiooxidans TaxID=1969821 RepID=A0ABV7I6S0_9HYPH|nr:EAL domain-containing protein [Ciceribacter thiooxidans]
MEQGANRRRVATFPLKVVLLTVCGTIALVVAAQVFLTWATRVIDDQSEARQVPIAEHVISQLRSRVAHDQESSTVWDEAVETVRKPPSPERDEWIDGNLGSWMISYFGHDAAFVLDPADRPIYAYVDDKISGPEAFDRFRSVTEPMASRLRDMLRRQDRSQVNDRVLSPGVSDFSRIGEHPAIVSVKPVVSDSGEIEQVPGQEYLHVAVKYLDSDFLQELSSEYGFHGLFFSPVSQKLPGTAELPIVADSGQIVGYFGWLPYRPGSAFLASISPALVGALLLLIITLTLFLLALYRRLKVNRAQEERIRFLANHDALTGLLNRTAFERELDLALMPAKGAVPQIAVLYLDLDRFKQINDTLGHGAGDDVIREVAKRIGVLLPPEGRLCRVGGDEFNIFVPFSEVSEVEALCSRIVSSIAEPFVIDGKTTFAGVSVGAAYSPLHGANRSELTRKADVALYNAKASGRGRFTTFGVHMDVIIRERAEIERDLHAALTKTGQFHVLYQPKYRARTGDLISVEALVRWYHPTRGCLSPTFFIPIAEEAGLIKALGRYVLEEACKAAAKWQIGSVAVNVSPIQWRNPGFASEVEATLEATGLDPHRLELEITETAWMDGTSTCIANIRALRDLGVAIALDDFGTGFSTFGRLHDTEVDHIKIDKSFIDGLGKSRGDEAIVQAIVDMAHAKGLKTTAEGVQTQEQSAFLTEIGCDELQGFLFSEPVSVRDIDKLLADGGQRARPQS